MLSSSLKRANSAKKSKSGSMRSKSRPNAVSMSFPSSGASLETLAIQDEQIRIQ